MSIDAIALIGSIATLLGGMWAMFERQQKSTNAMFKSQQEGFLDHLSKKNGFMERMDTRHQETWKEMQKAFNLVNEQLDRANENYVNVAEVLSDCAKVIDDHHKNCTK